tara:strand:+ start:60954 stop:61364 length:411 start_codon:yes stop_codon:yes gene_type:complete
MSLKKIKIVKLKIIKNLDGDVLKYLDKESKYFKKFGETYFSEILYKKRKGWNFHKKSQSLLAVPFGKVRFTFADDIKGKKKHITIGKNNYQMIVLPPGIWFSFTSLEKKSIVINTLNYKHSVKETLKKALSNKKTH